MTTLSAEVAGVLRDMDLATLGIRLRNARLAKGLTQGELAGDDASTAYISRIEAGQRRPDSRLLGKLAARVGTTVEDLVCPRVDLDLPVRLLAYADELERVGLGGAADDLRAVLAETGPVGSGDVDDVVAGRCCPACRTMLTSHNVSVWNAGYAIGSRHERETTQARVTSLADWHDTKAEKARRFPGAGNEAVMEKAAQVHDDAARRIREALA